VTGHDRADWFSCPKTADTTLPRVKGRCSNASPRMAGGQKRLTWDVALADKRHTMASLQERMPATTVGWRRYSKPAEPPWVCAADHHSSIDRAACSKKPTLHTKIRPTSFRQDSSRGPGDSVFNSFCREQTPVRDWFGGARTNVRSRPALGWRHSMPGRRVQIQIRLTL